MRGAILPLTQYAFMAWCSVKHRDFNFCLYLFIVVQPVPRAARSVLGRSNTGIAGSNPARGMDVYPLLSVFCCPV
jgi:hypothetical protein